MKLLLLFLILFGSAAMAEYEDKDISARVEAMGGAYIALADDPAAMHYNPAGVALNFRREMLTSYSKLYNISELIDRYIGITTPVLPFCNMGFANEEFGTGKYKEHKYTVSVAREVLKGHRIGFSFNQFMTAIENTEHHKDTGIDFGLISDLTSKAKIAFSGRNANHPNVDEQLRAYYRLGFLFLPNEKIKLLADFEKPQTVLREDKTAVHVGEEMELGDGVFFRVGYRTQPQRLSFGMGFEHRDINIDYSFTSHVDLSLTHRVSLGIKF
ncbi:MAG: hypothetical protein PHW04_06650 [Candidatus Wallbacteria bacterium]|nr:hypothetical protein [Candidatus Wallbacteria bacterium]